MKIKRQDTSIPVFSYVMDIFLFSHPLQLLITQHSLVQFFLHPVNEIGACRHRFGPALPGNPQKRKRGAFTPRIAETGKVRRYRPAQRAHPRPVPDLRNVPILGRIIDTEPFAGYLRDDRCLHGLGGPFSA